MVRPNKIYCVFPANSVGIEYYLMHCIADTKNYFVVNLKTQESIKRHIDKDRFYPSTQTSTRIDLSIY